ncbi:putative agmatine deiminase 2, partial [Tetrabaena socialis]
MPGEFEPHAGTWMSFPHDPALWRDGARPAQQQVADVARAISQFEQVWMLAHPRVAELARSHFCGVAGVHVVEQPTNDVWARDWGPT